MTGLETAIILIAFVTVAAVFGYAVLSAGLFASEREKETIYAGLQQARANMEVVGSVIAYGDAADPPTKVARILFTCRNAIAGSPIDMTPNRGSRENRCLISLTTGDAYDNNVKWTAQFIGKHDDDQLLEAGEQLEITLDMADLGAGFGDPAIGPNAVFNVQVKPTQGSTMTIQRTLPAAIDPVMDLDLITGGGNGAGGGGGLELVPGEMMTADIISGCVFRFTVSVELVSGGNPIDMSDSGAIAFDITTPAEGSANNLPWVSNKVVGDGDNMLEPSESYTTRVDLSGFQALHSDDTFTLSATPAGGSTYPFQIKLFHFPSNFTGTVSFNNNYGL